MMRTNIPELVVELIGDNSQFIQVMTQAETQFLRSVGRIEGHVSRMGATLTQMGQMLTVGLTVPITALGTAAVYEFGQFDDAMTKTAAIMEDLTPAMRGAMEEQAMLLSGEATASATELANGYYHLAQTGYDAAEAISVIDDMQNFAVAGSFDLAKATELLIDSQHSLGMATGNLAQDEQNLIRISDVLVKAANESQASVEEMAKALTNKASGQMRLLGVSVEEGAAALGMFAKQGVRGQRAGEYLYMALRDLGGSIRRQPEAWAELGMSVFDAEGDFRGLIPVMKQLEMATAGLSDEEKMLLIHNLGFQDRSSHAIRLLMGMSEEMAKFQDVLQSAGGETLRLAQENLKSFNAQMIILWNNAKNAGILIGKELAPYLLILNQYVKEALQWWMKLDAGWRQFTIVAALILAVIGPLVVVLGTLVTVAGMVISAITAILVVGWPVVAMAAGIAAGITAIIALLTVFAAGLIAVVTYVILFRKQVVQHFTYIANNWEMMLDGFIDLWSKVLLIAADNLKVFMRIGIRMWFAWMGFIGGILKNFFEGDALRIYGQYLIEVMRLTFKYFSKIQNIMIDALTGSLTFEKVFGDLRAGSKQNLVGVFNGIIDEEMRGLRNPFAPLMRNWVSGAAGELSKATQEQKSDAIWQKWLQEGFVKGAQDAAPAMNEALHKALTGFYEGLQDSLFQLRYTRNELDAFKLAQEGATDEQVAWAHWAATMTDALDQAHSMLEDNRTPLEKYADSLENLNNLWNLGVIDAELYNRQLEKLQTQLSKDLGSLNQVSLQATGGIQGKLSGSADANASLEAFQAGMANQKKIWEDQKLKLQQREAAKNDPNNPMNPDSPNNPNRQVENILNLILEQLKKNAPPDKSTKPGKDIEIAPGYGG